MITDSTSFRTRRTKGVSKIFKTLKKEKNFDIWNEHGIQKSETDQEICFQIPMRLVNALIRQLHSPGLEKDIGLTTASLIGSVVRLQMTVLRWIFGSF